MVELGISIVAGSGLLSRHSAFKVGPLQLRCRTVRKTSHLPYSSRRNQGLQFTTTTLRRHSLICSAASSSSSGGALDAPSGSTNGSVAYSTANHVSDTTAKAARRSARLQSALLLRKLYRNLLRAEPLLQLPSPVYQPPEESPSSGAADVLDSENATSMDLAAAAAAADAQRQAQLEERIEEAVVLVAEMELTAEELRLGLRALKSQPERYGLLFSNSSKNSSTDPSELEDQIQRRVKDIYAQLMDRVSKEITELPFSSISVAQAALDARNAKFRALGLPPALESIGDGDGAPEGGYYLAAEARRGLGERLGEAERVAERFLARRLQPAVARVRDEMSTSPESLIEGVQKSATWARGLWDRLNGSAYDGASSAAPSGLPLPSTLESDRAVAVEALHGEIEELEKKLQEASKARETRLRKAGIQGRARMAAELRQMDNEVAAVSRALAVRTLQLEMEYIYGCLEGEVIDILGDPSAAAAAASQQQEGPSSIGSSVALALSRRGSTDEVALLAAEFRQLDAELAAMASEVEAGGALYIDDGDIAALATEIPDLRLRLGVGDNTVFGGSGLSLSKMQMQLRQAVSTITEAANFGTRGVRLLGSDVGAAGRLFWRALLGGTLKPREVAALRRTARDLLTFIPFAIILILPLTPIGHVLIFGFIQRYFPGFFPSQFTNRRQDLMVKYEQLTKQLQEAQVAAEAESDELEFRKAAAKAVAEAQLRSSGSASGGSGGSMTGGSTSSSDGSDLANGGGGGGASTENENGGAGNGNGTAGAPILAAGEDDETEGPAAKAVRKLQEEIAAAADSSYTETLDLE